MSFLYRPTPNPYRPHLPSIRQPLYLHLRPLWLGLEKALATFSGRVLDIGCGLQPYRPMLGPNVTEYVGVDRPGELSNPTVIGTAESLPFENESFDAVLSTQVYEHVPDPGRCVAEAVRVLKPGGRIVLTVPGVWPTHEAPYDYWRFTRHGLKHLLAEKGIDCPEPEAHGRLWATVGQMANLELSRISLLRQLVPIVNLVFGALDKRSIREDLVMNWFVDGTRKL